MHYRRVGVALLLLLNGTAFGAPRDGRSHDVDEEEALSISTTNNATLTRDSNVLLGDTMALTSTSTTTTTIIHGKREPKKKKPKKNEMKLPPKQQAMEDVYHRMYHDDDEYAEWSRDKNLGRGPAWSKVLRLTLYENPGKVIADRGIGLGKAWEADETGYIRDRTEEVRKLPALYKQRLGLLPRKNRRLPPRSGRGDPTMTADLPVETTKRLSDYEMISNALTAASKEIIQKALLAMNNNDDGDTAPAREEEIVTVNGTPLAVVSSVTPAVEIITVDGTPVEVVSSVTMTTTSSSTTSSSSSSSSSSSNVHDAPKRRLNGRALKPLKPPLAREILPELKPLLSKFENKKLGQSALRLASKRVTSSKWGLDTAVEWASGGYKSQDWSIFSKTARGFTQGSGGAAGKAAVAEVVGEVQQPAKVAVNAVAKPAESPGILGRVIGVLRALAQKFFGRMFPKQAAQGVIPTAIDSAAHPLLPEIIESGTQTQGYTAEFSDTWKSAPHEFGELNPAEAPMVEDWLEGLKSSYTPKQWASLGGNSATDPALLSGRPEAIESSMRAMYESIGADVEQYTGNIRLALGKMGPQLQSKGLYSLDAGQPAFENFLSRGGDSTSWYELKAATQGAKDAARKAASNAAADAAERRVAALAAEQAAGDGAADAAAGVVGEGVGQIAGDAAVEGVATAEIAGELAFDGAFEATAMAAEGVALSALNILPIVGQIASVVLLFVTVLTTLLQLLLHKKRKFPHPPDGKISFAWDWDGRPYQYDDAHPKKKQGAPPSPTAPPEGCDTFDMESLIIRGWTTTQYALHPCPTWVPEECTYEWYRDNRLYTKRRSNTRHNPVYCFDSVPFKPKHRRFTAGYEEALKHSGVAEFSQYAGHELAELEGCLGPDKPKDEAKGKPHKEKIIQHKSCHHKYLPRMAHHNLRLKDCKGKECEMQADKWQYMTTGWPTKQQGCKNGKQLACWKRWLQKRFLGMHVDDLEVEEEVVVHPATVEIDQRDLLYSNISLKATPTTTRVEDDE